MKRRTFVQLLAATPLASNLCAIVQQGITLRMLKAQDERRSPAKTRRT